MTASTTHSHLADDPVAQFYERHPYPPPVADLDAFPATPGDARVEHHRMWPERDAGTVRAVLVAGCGTSQAVRHALRRPGARVVGIDLSEAAAQPMLTEDGRFAYHGFTHAWYGKWYDHQYNTTKAFGITDRPVYRPNQTAKFKFWVGQAEYDQRAPSTIPAARAPARNVSCLASMLPASRSGTRRMSALPATSEAIPFTAAASALIAFSSPRPAHSCTFPSISETSRSSTTKRAAGSPSRARSWTRSTPSPQPCERGRSRAKPFAPAARHVKAAPPPGGSILQRSSGGWPR
jgi:hypothetical protein